MELTVLNKQFQPSKLVEGHSSLIWTERWTSSGDFERVSNDIGGTLQMLPITDESGKPINTIVSLRDSDVPMIVETHKIEKTISGPQITTYGRSLETCLDRRTTIKDSLGAGRIIKPWITTYSPTAADAAYEAMNEVVTKAAQNGRAQDAIPDFTIVPVIRPTGYVAPKNADGSLKMKPISVDPGELYAWVLSQVTSEKYALRARRPINDLSVSTVAIEIYTGTDRTTKVVFDARFDQFDSSTHLLSQAGLKNVDQVAAVSDSLEVLAPFGGIPTGLDRRVVYNDATQYATGAPGATLTSIMQNLGTVDLAKQLQTALFSGEVTRQKGAAYGKDFFLGDVVKLSGDYGLSQFVRIAEFIRSEDSSGEKAYPTFASL